MNKNLIHNRHSYGHNQDIFWIQVPQDPQKQLHLT